MYILRSAEISLQSDRVRYVPITIAVSEKMQVSKMANLQSRERLPAPIAVLADLS
jgi:hypothetical protein